MKPRDPLVVVPLPIGIALLPIGLDTFRSTVRVTAQDGPDGIAPAKAR